MLSGALPLLTSCCRHTRLKSCCKCLPSLKGTASTILAGCTVLLQGVHGVDGWGSCPPGQSFFHIGHVGITQLSNQRQSLTCLSFTCCVSCDTVSLFCYNTLEHLRWSLDILLFFSHFIVCWNFTFSTHNWILQDTAVLFPAPPSHLRQQKAGYGSTNWVLTRY